MAQKLIQTQEQKQIQLQRLTQQQLLQVRLMEMPVAELEENVNAELDDNPALERAADAEVEGLDPCDADNRDADRSADDDYEATDDRESGASGDADDDYSPSDADLEPTAADRESEIDKALGDMSSDDEMPPTWQPDSRDGAEYEEMVYGDTASFYDKLSSQVGECELTPKQRDIMEYLIGSLDDDGLLRKDADTLADELTLFNNIDCSPRDVDEMIATLQTFDPAGIGARSLQECLLLQLRRRPESHARQLALVIIGHYYADFAARHWDTLKRALRIDDSQLDAFRDEIRRLNPKPGASLGEAEGRSMQQITPDFVVETSDDGASIHIYLNSGDVPELRVSPSFAAMVATYRNNRKGMSRQEKEALLYAKEKVDKAQGYIEAIRQRRATLMKTMQAIVDWQRKFFIDGDEADLRPMVLKDLATKTGLDISTISRVCSVKYCQTNWGTYPLRFFFNSKITNDKGEEVSARNIKIALREIVDAEDKKAPLSDDAIARLMAQRNLPIARRTVSKYREQLSIPAAKQRRQ